MVSCLAMKSAPEPSQTRTPSADAQREALASIGMFAAAMAHEIRNPLTAIKARLFTLNKALTADSPAHEDAAFIGQEIVRLERIVREFLQYARPGKPVPAAIAVGEFLHGMLSFFQRQTEGTGVELAIGEVTAAQVMADPHQIKQVLINLVQNAVESIGDTGRITLSARAGVMSDGRAAVIFEVIDTGKGIPSEFDDHLFDPFFTDKPSGTGLGLPIAARVVAAHGGTLTFRSEMNRGTTFAIALPAATLS